uniref:Uncharacterized protein n=1 Tax=viral metagenome TaxID=1070528 RepID=A0A6C0KD78_9ZZZZ
MEATEPVDEADTKEDVEGSITDSITAIREKVEQICHVSKHMHTRAVRINCRLENPDLDIWIQPFKLHSRAVKWAKKNMLASVCSFFQVHQLLQEIIKKENRIITSSKGLLVKLSSMESDILDLPVDEPLSIWVVLGKLPRFFV